MNFDKIKVECENTLGKTYGLYEVDEMMQKKGFCSEIGDTTQLPTVADLEFLDRFQDDFGASYVWIEEYEDDNFEVQMYCQFHYEITHIFGLEEFKKEPRTTVLGAGDIEVRIVKVNVYR